MNFYNGRLRIFISSGQLPLAVRRIGQRPHPERLFHDHDFSELVLVESGEALHIVGGAEAPIRQGDVLLLHPGAVHAYDRVKDFRIVNLIYDSKKLAPPVSQGRQLPFLRHVFPDHGFPEASSMLKPVLRLKQNVLLQALESAGELDAELKSGRPGRDLSAYALFLELIQFLARQRGGVQTLSRERDGIFRALAYLNEHAAESVSVEYLLGLAHMSRRNFFRSFRLIAGCAPIEYQRDQKLRMAVEHLLETDEAVGEIAGLCGFYDSNFFCKQFRKAFCVSPREFRRQSRKNMPDQSGSSNPS